MGHQSQIFLDGEGAAWLERNKEKLPVRDDHVLRAIEVQGIKPRKVLEIGCANGWRLKELRARYNCECHGLDPGVTHIHAHQFIEFYRGTARDLHLFKDGQFDLVIYGFCLYLCDPEDYFRIAMEGDRVLADNGIIITHDFSALAPHAVAYKHKAGIFTRKMTFPRLWLSHPAYKIHVSGMDEQGIETCLMRKNMSAAFPVKHEKA